MEQAFPKVFRLTFVANSKLVSAMNKLNKACRIAMQILLLTPVLIISVQAQRVSNNTLIFPTTLPTGDYLIENLYNLEPILAMDTPQGETNQLYLAQRSGRIALVSDLNNETLETTPFLDISFRVTTTLENGLLGFTFHPNYTTNGYFYVFYTTNASGQATNRLSRFSRSSQNPLLADPDSELILFDQRDQANNHNGGDIHFGPDSYLYVSLGDEGGANDSFQNGQRIDKDLFAGLLRIDVDKKTENPEPTNHPAIPTYQNGLAAFSIPADNPLVSRWQNEGSFTNSSLRLEFYAIGLRNPWRFTIDKATGDIWVSDVGQGAWEEVDLIVKGGNYGWPIREGRHSGPSNKSFPNDFGDLLDPIHEYGRSDGSTITGGIVYRGSQLPEIYGAYLFSDFYSGKTWALFKGQPNETAQVVQITSISNAATYTADPRNGEALVASISGAVGQLSRGSQSPTPSFPQTLSETGAFENLNTLDIEAGIYAYEPNVAFWSDHAIKTRWITIPVSEQVTYRENEPWTFPTGFIWIKHFELEMERGNPASRHRVETRFLVKTDRGIYGLSYQWNEAQDEATLVPEEGSSIEYSITVDGDPVSQTWNIPSRQQCLTCHTQAAGYALSFNTRQLNHSATIDQQEQNTLSYFSEIGILDTHINNPETLPRHYAATDETVSLEKRARSYLAVNCVSCHQPNASAPLSWDARPHLSTGDTGLINGIAANNGGDNSKRLVIRGNPEQSILLGRLAERNAFTRMPPIGSNIHDVSGIALLTDWISLSQPSDISFSDWQILHFGNIQAPNADPTADPDNDGNSNRLEYLNRTQPLDNSSAWHPQFERSGNTITVQFPMSPNRAFKIETSDDLSKWTDWQVTGNPPTSDEIETLDANIKGPLPEDSNNVFLRIAIDSE